MRTVTIRESAFRACRMWGVGGGDLLMDAISQAFDGTESTFDSKYPNALLEAIVPDIRDTLRDEDDRPTVGIVHVALGPGDGTGEGATADAPAGTDREDGGE